MSLPSITAETETQILNENTLHSKKNPKYLPCHGTHVI